MFAEEILRIRGTCNCVGGGRWNWVTNIAAKKSNHSLKNWKLLFDFFGCNFCYPITPPPSHNHPGTLKFAILSLCQTFFENLPIAVTGPSNLQYRVFINSFENLKFSKMLDEDAILQTWEFCDCDGSGGCGGKEIIAEKSENIGRTLKKRLSAKSTARLYIKVWMRQVSQPSCQTSSHSTNLATRLASVGAPLNGAPSPVSSPENRNKIHLQRYFSLGTLSAEKKYLRTSDRQIFL